MLLEVFLNNMNPFIVKRIETSDYDNLFELHKNNKYYYSLFSNNPISKEDVLSGLDKLPPDTKQSQKLYIGIYKESKLLACMDVIEEYPGKDTVFIGLLMLDILIQGQGLASRIMEAFLQSVCQCGYSKVRLGCLKSNKKAFDFWVNQGFIKTEKKIIDGHDIVVMEKN